MNTIIKIINKESTDSQYIPKDKELICIDGCLLVIGNGKDNVQQLLSLILDGGNAK